MIGNRVRLITSDGKPDAIEGTLHKVDSSGAVIYRTNILPEGQGNVFIPLHRIQEIVDLGRAP